MGVNELIGHLRNLKTNDDMLAAKLVETIKVGNENCSKQEQVNQTFKNQIDDLVKAILLLMNAMNEKDKRLKELESHLAEKILLTT